MGNTRFFVSIFISLNLLKIIWFAQNMSILSNVFLAGIVWLTIAIGRPFTLQYARADLPKKNGTILVLLKVADLWQRCGCSLFVFCCCFHF